jgi:ATP synthase protein I
MTRPAGTGAAWDLSFLRIGALSAMIAAAVAAPVAGLLGGWGSALAVLAGAAVVTFFFSISGVTIAWAGRIDDSLTLPAALGTFLVKLLVLAALLAAVPANGALDRPTLAWTVVAGALLWSGVHMRWVWTRQLYYVPPPAPPRPTAPAEPAAAADPESPAPRA